MRRYPSANTVVTHSLAFLARQTWRQLAEGWQLGL
jgi:hypothetical protein